MRFGVCCNPADIARMEAIGFDYVEGNATQLFRMEEEAFERVREQVLACSIRVEAFNCLFPAERKILLDPAAEAAYLDALFPRMTALGGRLVVFGSGYARACPEGMDKQDGQRRMAALCRLLAQKAATHGMQAVIEPLNPAETNMVNTQEQARQLAGEVGHPAFGLLADFYHMSAVGDSAAEVGTDGSLLRHAHIAAPGTRSCPSPSDGVDYRPFFDGLAGAGYQGRISYEGGGADDGQYRQLLAFLKEQTTSR